jgi:NAD(P)-dependent dehydrogenase (short-subunit alcohol dehydrogenase family)
MLSDDGPSPSTSTPSTARFRDKIVVVTGGGSGIGKSLAHAFAREGARLVLVDLKDSHTMARDLNSSRGDDSFHLAFTCDVTNSRQIRNMIQQVKRKYGRIDIYCSNAGIILPRDANNNDNGGGDGNDDSIARHSDSQWTKILQINLQSHIIAFRELIPDWEAGGKGDGIIVITASAAGLLTQIGDASYGVSKAAVVSLAEHMAITHGSKVQVHCLAPQAVDTPFVDQLLKEASTAKSSSPNNSAMTDGIISPDVVAECTLQAIEDGSFWIFPHRRVKEYVHRKATDHARWLRGMQKLRLNLKNQQHVSKL